MDFSFFFFLMPENIEAAEAVKFTHIANFENKMEKRKHSNGAILK